MKILVASDCLAVKLAGGYREFIAKQGLEYWNDERALPCWEIDGPPIRAEINASKWCVLCECGERCVIEPGEAWFCWYCLNKRNGGKARMILWPGERAEIEAVLLKRFKPLDRNWTVETVDELKRENLAHGEEV